MVKRRHLFIMKMRLMHIIEFIKLAVPSSKRSWNRDEKAWYVDASYKDAMALMFKGKGYTVDIFSKEDFVKFMEENAKFQQEYQRMSATVNAEQEFPKFIGLLEKANMKFSPAAIAELQKDEGFATKYYRKAALQFHPDRNNGDGKMMSELNATWANLREYHFKTKVAVQ
jgi:hypothetical protein